MEFTVKTTESGDVKVKGTIIGAEKKNALIIPDTDKDRCVVFKVPVKGM